jgi:HAMP domain-containing protein
MELLLFLTLIYIGVLVVALAASLIAIWIYLRRISRALGEVREALAAARRETGPLEDALRPLRDLFEETAGEMNAAESALEQADEALAERLGAGSVAH